MNVFVWVFLCQHRAHQPFIFRSVDLSVSAYFKAGITLNMGNQSGQFQQREWEAGNDITA